MSEHRGTVDEDTQEFEPFPFEQGEKMTEEKATTTQSEKKEKDDKSSGKKYDGGSIPKAPKKSTD